MKKREYRRACAYWHGISVKNVRTRITSHNWDNITSSSYEPTHSPGCFGYDARHLSPFAFAKDKSVGCRCRRRTRGSPKIPGGICRGNSSGKYQASVHERIEGKKLCKDWERVINIYDSDL